MASSNLRWPKWCHTFVEIAAVRKRSISAFERCRAHCFTINIAEGMTSFKFCVNSKKLRSAPLIPSKSPALLQGTSNQTQKSSDIESKSIHSCKNAYILSIDGPSHIKRGTIMGDKFVDRKFCAWKRFFLLRFNTAISSSILIVRSSRFRGSIALDLSFQTAQKRAPYDQYRP